MSEKIYCGKGKKGNYSIKLNISLDSIPAEYINEWQGKRYLKLELKELKQPDQKGNTHTIIVDTWRPDGDKADHDRGRAIHNEQKQNGYAPQQDAELPF